MENLIPAIEAIESHYFLDGEQVDRRLLVIRRIQVTGYNSDRVSDEKLLDVPGVRIERDHSCKRSRERRMGWQAQTRQIEAQHAYLSRTVSWGFVECHAPILRRTSVYLLLDFPKMETRRVSRDQKEFSSWEPVHPYEYPDTERMRTRLATETKIKLPRWAG